MVKKLVIVAFCTLALIQVVAAQGQDPTAMIRAKLSELVPGLKPDSVKASPIAGLYQVMYGAEVLYFTVDGRYMLRGSLLDLDRQENLTEQARNGVRKTAMEEVGEDQMIVFAPEKVKHTITVFTDIDCPYCRKLHAEMDQYEDLGIKVRYLMFPRAGVGSNSYNTAVSVWCADDSNTALTVAKQGKAVEEKRCDNPVDEHMQLGQQVGVTGTPAIVLDNGELLPGYQPAKRLAAALDKMKHKGAQSATK